MVVVVLPAEVGLLGRFVTLPYSLDGFKEALVPISVTFKLEKDVRLGLLGQLSSTVILFPVDQVLS